jgi:hypothetical protein
MDSSSLALAVAFHAMRGMYLHAERLLAKAGRQGARGGVSPTAKRKRNAGTERAKRSGGLHKHSAEVWGDPLRRAGAAPSARFGFRFRAQRRSYQGWALRTGTGPLGRVAEDAKRLQPGRRLLPVNELFYGHSILRFLGRARFVSISDNPDRPAVRRTPGFDGDIRLETYGKKRSHP